MNSWAWYAYWRQINVWRLWWQKTKMDSQSEIQEVLGSVSLRLQFDGIILERTISLFGEFNFIVWFENDFLTKKKKVKWTSTVGPINFIAWNKFWKRHFLIIFNSQVINVYNYTYILGRTISVFREFNFIYLINLKITF